MLLNCFSEAVLGLLGVLPFKDATTSLSLMDGHSLTVALGCRRQGGQGEWWLRGGGGIDGVDSDPRTSLSVFPPSTGERPTCRGEAVLGRVDMGPWWLGRAPVVGDG